MMGGETSGRVKLRGRSEGQMTGRRLRWGTY